MKSDLKRWSVPCLMICPKAPLYWFSSCINVVTSLEIIKNHLNSALESHSDNMVSCGASRCTVMYMRSKRLSFKSVLNKPCCAATRVV
jgi:hypothetical protein